LPRLSEILKWLYVGEEGTTFSKLLQLCLVGDNDDKWFISLEATRLMQHLKVMEIDSDSQVLIIGVQQRMHIVSKIVELVEGGTSVVLIARNHEKIK
jgi:hypothetical protein